MATTLKGAAMVWGAGGVTMTGIIESAKASTQSVNLNYESEVQEIADEKGEVRGMCFYNHKQTIEFSVIPIDGSGTPTLANAKTNLNNLLIKPGTVVTIVDTDHEKLIQQGKFIVLNSRLGRSNKGFATIDVTCVAYEAYDVTTTVS